MIFGLFKKSEKDSNTDKKKAIIFKIADMHCVSCSLTIDGTLEELEGVISATTSFAKAETKIEYHPDKISIKKLQKVIEETGYTVAQ